MLKKKRVLEVGGMFRRDAPFLELGCDPKTRMNPQLFKNGLRNDARDFESPSSAIPTHRRIGLNDFYYTGFSGQNQEKVCVFFQIVLHGVKYMTPVLARRRGLCYTKVRSKRK